MPGLMLGTALGNPMLGRMRRLESVAVLPELVGAGTGQLEIYVLGDGIVSVVGAGLATVELVATGAASVPTVESAGTITMPVHVNGGAEMPAPVGAGEVTTSSPPPAPAATFPPLSDDTVDITGITYEAEVTHLCVTETATQPAVDDPGWVTAASSIVYTTASSGSVTLYLWAKSVGGVSATAASGVTVVAPGLVLDQDLAIGVTVVGGKITAIVDQSAAGNDYAQSDANLQPLASTDGGFASAYFDGVNDIMTCTWASLPAQKTQFYVFTPDLDTPPTFLAVGICHAGGATDFDQWWNSGTLNVYDGAATSAADTFVGRRLLTIRTQGAGSTIRFDGVVVTTADLPGYSSETSVNLTLGGRSGTHFKGHHLRSIILDNAASDEVISAVEAYLLDKYDFFG